MKNLKCREKRKDNDVKREEKRKLDRELARIERIPYYTKEEKEERKKNIKEKISNKKKAYEQEKISKQEYIKWLKDNRK